ncbi:MAG: methylenetetrahydrofolate reductase, partial [Muribaculaceae bacterium]|nr:methylenetetrahydrofolate reductase [Muribaculaceae bacterium]
LNFLGIQNLLLLRGDCKSLETVQQDPELYHEHATDLQAQVNLFNQGFSLDGTRIQGIDTPFTYGMACYPEKHEEAPNMASDIYWAKKKVDAGASYLVTQMFFDNQKYFDFVARCRQAGINVPIIPGIKPIVFGNQLNILPRVFRTDLPEDLADALLKCRTEEEVREVGVEWSINQCRELIEGGVDALHFYTFLASDSVHRIAKAIY